MSGQLESLMFGRLLDITPSRVWVSAAVLIVAALILVATWRAQVALAFDREAARVAGIPTLAIDIVFNAAIGAIVVAASTAVGVLLVVGYLIVPGACGRILAPGTRSMGVLAAGLSLLSAPRPLSPQACVALGVLACFALACLARPILRRRAGARRGAEADRVGSPAPAGGAR